MRKRNVATKINEDDQQFQEFKRRYIEVSNSDATDWDISEPWEAFEDDKKLTDTKLNIDLFGEGQICHIEI